MRDETKQVEGNDMSLEDMTSSLKRNYKAIVLCAAVGLLLSAVYMNLAPKIYEAAWQIRMAQMGGDIVSNGYTSIEEPSALAQRLRFPTAYSVEVRHSCGMPENGVFGEYLNKTLEIQPTKNVPTTVDMRFRATDADMARQCAEAIVMMIEKQQRALVQERLAVYQELMRQYQQSLEGEQKQLENIKISGLSNLGYLAGLDKLSLIRSRMVVLQEEISMSQRQPTKLTAPIYVSSKPISPKAEFAGLLGILAGLMFGVLYALGWGAGHKKN